MVKCKDCGYLAIRNIETRSLCEAEEEFRATGDLPKNFTGAVIFEPVPICFRRCRPRSDYGKTIAEIARQLNESISCDSFTDWKHGYSPREHLEMDMLEQQKQWHKQQEDSDRKWREQQADKEHQWRTRETDRAERAFAQANEQHATEMKQSHRQHLVNLIVFGVLITIVAAVAQIVAALVERGVIFPSQPN